MGQWSEIMGQRVRLWGEKWDGGALEWDYGPLQ